MKANAWLTVNERGSMRVTKNKPVLAIDEVSVYLDITIPNELFRKPKLQANIEIPPEAAVQEYISTAVIDNIQEHIRLTHGLDLCIKVIEPEPDE